jgi:hypothetical protein
MLGVTTLFSQIPTEAELQSLVAPKESWTYVTLQDDGTRFLAQLGPYLQALYWFPMSMIVMDNRKCRSWHVEPMGKFSDIRSLFSRLRSK